MSITSDAAAILSSTTGVGTPEQLAAVFAEIDAAIASAGNLSAEITNRSNADAAINAQLGTTNGFVSALQTSFGSLQAYAIGIHDDYAAARPLIYTALQAATPTQALDPTNNTVGITPLSLAASLVNSLLNSTALSRPGDGPKLFGSSLQSGDPSAVPALTLPVIASDFGPAARITGAGTVAARQLFGVEPNRIYKLRFKVQRRVDTPDPSNDAVRCGVAYYDNGKQATNVIALHDYTSFLVATGQQELSAVLSTNSAAAGVTNTIPDGTCYLRPYVQTWGTLCVTDVQVIEWRDITDAGAVSVDVSAVSARVTTLESLNAGSRLTTLEGEFTSPFTRRFQTRSDAIAATIPSFINTVTTTGYTLSGLGGATYRRVTSAPTVGFQSADGAYWSLSEPRVTLRMLGAAGDGVADDHAVFAGAPAGVVYVDAGTYLLSADATNTTTTFVLSPSAVLTGTGQLYAKVQRPANFYAGSMATLGEVTGRAEARTPITIACYGDSLTYGYQDPTVTGLPPAGPPINGYGTTNNRSAYQYPESLGNALSYCGITATIYNRGYPGDSTIEGLTRWASASATDISFLMFGTNDIGNYGANGIHPVDQYRRNMAMLIEREILKGAVVIVIGPPPNGTGSAADRKLRSYVSACRELAERYGVLYVDAAEQLGGMWDPSLNTSGAMYSDGLHLSGAGYLELGWHLAALFAGRGKALTRAAPGRTLWPQDRAFYTPESSFYPLADSRSGQLLPVAPTETVILAVRVDEPCIPVITTLNVSPGTSRALTANYAISAYSDPIVATNSDVESEHQSTWLYKLYPGFRIITFTNNLPTTAYIEKVEFRAVETALATTYGSFHRSSLAGVLIPAKIPNDWWAAIDRSKYLDNDPVISARLILPATVLCGLAIMPKPTGVQTYGASDQTMVLRNGANLVIRKLVANTPTDTTIAGVFPATGDWSGRLELRFTTSSGTVAVYKDDGSGSVGMGSATGLPSVKGFAALVSLGYSRAECVSCMTASGPFAF